PSGRLLCTSMYRAIRSSPPSGRLREGDDRSATVPRGGLAGAGAPLYDSPAVRTVAIQLLGRFSVAIDGVPISGDAWRSRRAADVLKLLALAPAHRVHRTEVMETLWPESDPEASGTNLRKALHFARLATGDERAIVNERGVLVLWPDAHVETDVERFEAAAQRALDGEDEPFSRRSVSGRPPSGRPIRVLVGRAARPLAPALPGRAARRSAVGSAHRRR